MISRTAVNGSSSRRSTASSSRRSSGSPATACSRCVFARALATAALASELPRDLLLNVNVPPGVEPDGYVVTRLGKHSYGSDVVEKKDPRGRSYFWIGGNEYQHEDIPGSDCNAVLREKRVSVTPLMLDLTDEKNRARVAAWKLEGFRQF